MKGRTDADRREFQDIRPRRMRFKTLGIPRPTRAHPFEKLRPLRADRRGDAALALRRVDLHLDQDPPIIIIRADSQGNKARKGREVPVPADLLESLRDLASFHGKDRNRPMLDLSRQRIGQVMKDAAVQAGTRRCTRTGRTQRLNMTRP